jgi:hypothetical protein
MMAVYTPLLRCATASEACNLASGLRTKANGELLSVPRFAFLGLASDACILSEPLPTESQDTREVVYRRSLQAISRSLQLMLWNLSFFSPPIASSSVVTTAFYPLG